MAYHSKVDPTEELGRGIFSSSIAKRSRRAIPKNVFLEREGNARISVDRLSIAPAIESIRIADEVAVQRNRKFYGWAIISAESASQNGRSVEASALIHNQFHADIVLPPEANKREEQIMHAQLLADLSNWRARP
ncbi:MAG: hypothetical protein OXI60_01830 [Acidiferrobacterales bacterium]|nr:hypothetical protein [Acidiferrobacterales bacterium]